MWGLGVDTDVIQNLPDLHAPSNKGDQAHLPAADRAQQREHFVDSGDQSGPQVVRWALGRHRLGLGWEYIAQQRHPLRALARGGWRSQRRGWLRRCGLDLGQSHYGTAKRPVSVPVHQSSDADVRAVVAPGPHPLCAGAPWQRVVGRSSATAAPARRGHVPGCAT